MLLAIDADWAFTPLGQIDPWVYFGTFVNLSYNLTNFSRDVLRRPTVVDSSRISCACAPAARSRNAVLHLAVFYAATVGCYSLLSMATVGRRPALVVSLLLGAYQPFLNAVGWDYVDGAGLAYFSLACACGTAADQGKRPLLWSAPSGVFAGACIITNIAWLMMMPGFCHLSGPALAAGGPRAYVRLGLALGAGTTAITVACAIVYARITGNYWFFLPSITVSRALVSQSNPWQSQSYDWAWDNALLGTACAVFCSR